jgi:hypothetical protein
VSTHFAASRKIELIVNRQTKVLIWPNEELTWLTLPRHFKSKLVNATLRITSQLCSGQHKPCRADDQMRLSETQIVAPSGTISRKDLSQAFIAALKGFPTTDHILICEKLCRARVTSMKRALNTILVAVLFWIELMIVIVIVDTIFPYVNSWGDLIATCTILIGNFYFAIWIFSRHHSNTHHSEPQL